MPPPELIAAGPIAPFAAPALVRAAAALSPAAGRTLGLVAAASAAARQRALIDCLDAAPADAPLASAERDAGAARRAVDRLAPRTGGGARVRRTARSAALFRRTPTPAAVRAEARFDGARRLPAHPAGGSSRQFLLESRARRRARRLIGAREAARLMGLPDSYRLPARRNEAYHLLGDGVVAPVVRFLSRALLLPLLATRRGRAAKPARRRA